MSVARAEALLPTHQRGLWGMLVRCGPLSLVAASFVLVGGGLSIRTAATGALALVVELAVMLVLVGRTGFALVRLLPGVLALASVAWSNWLLADPRSVEAAAVAGGRLAYFVLPGLVLVSYLDPFTVGDHAGQRLHLPARPVLAFVAALQRLDSLVEDWETLARTRRVRGLGPDRGGGLAASVRGRVAHAVGMLFGLLVQAIRQAGRMTVAMEARGYSAQSGSGIRRTWAEPAPWTSYDTALIVVAFALAVLPVVLGAL